MKIAPRTTNVCPFCGETGVHHDQFPAWPMRLVKLSLACMALAAAVVIIEVLT